MSSKKKRKNKVTQDAKTIFLNGLFFKNPVAIGALGLFPVVAASSSLKIGAALSLMMLVMMLPVCLISGSIGKSVPNWVRPGMVLILSAIFYLPAQMIVETCMSVSMNALGLYGGLMIANSIVLSRANDYAPNHISLAIIADSLGCTLGFTFILCLFSAIRELLTKGTLWGSNFYLMGTVQKGILSSFFGFILLGFLSALIQFVNNKKEQKEEKKGKRA